jgi:hypothetical protein
MVKTSKTNTSIFELNIFNLLVKSPINNLNLGKVDLDTYMSMRGLGLSVHWV